MPSRYVGAPVGLGVGVAVGAGDGVGVGEGVGVGVGDGRGLADGVGEGFGLGLASTVDGALSVNRRTPATARLARTRCIASCLRQSTMASNAHISARIHARTGDTVRA
jgi:hypothetical protein